MRTAKEKIAREIVEPMFDFDTGELERMNHKIDELQKVVAGLIVLLDEKTPISIDDVGNI